MLSENQQKNFLSVADFCFLPISEEFHLNFIEKNEATLNKFANTITYVNYKEKIYIMNTLNYQNKFY